MPPSRDDVVVALRSAFGADRAEAMQHTLDLYGEERFERERERVQLAIIELCAGSEERLRELVQIAKTDYRDVLAWRELGPTSDAEGEALRRDARALIERWGKR